MITDIVYPLKQATRTFQSFYLVIWLICLLYRYTVCPITWHTPAIKVCTKLLHNGWIYCCHPYSLQGTSHISVQVSIYLDAAKWTMCTQPGLGQIPFIFGTYISFRHFWCCHSAYNGFGIFPFSFFSFKISWLCLGQHIFGCSRRTAKTSPDVSTI